MSEEDALTTEEVDSAALFAKLKGWVRQSMGDHAEWYREAEECFAFVAGRGFWKPGMAYGGQWPERSWDEMMASGRQPIEFNRIGPIVDAICGLEVNNRQDTKYLPRTEGDVKANERLSSLGDWARDEAHAEDEESDMFRNAVICGRGATETRIDFDEEPTGRIVIDSLDPLECGVDPAAKKACFADRRFSWRYRDIPCAEAKAMFPGVAPGALHASWARRIDTEDGGEGNKTDYPDEPRPALRDQADPKIVRVVQIEWFENDVAMLVAAPGSDQPTEIPLDAWEKLSDEERADVPATRVTRRRYRKAFLGFASILEEKEIETFQIQWTTGRYDRNRKFHYGVVRPMRDPQMLSNKTLAQVLHILSTQAKGGLIYEQGVFRNPRDAEKDWSDPKKNVPVNEGKLDKIKERTAPPMPVALAQLQEFALSSIRDVTGANVEMLGMADRDQAASLEFQRRQSAMTILAGLFSGLRHYRKLQGRTLLSQLKLLPPGVLVRVLIDPEVAQAEFQAEMMQWQQAAAQAQAQGQQPPPQPEPPGAEFLSQTKRGEVFDPTKFGLGPDARFDVIVDEAPSSPNQKEATWAAIQPFVGQLPPQAFPIVLKASPLPESVAVELGDAIANAGQPDDQTAQMIQAGQARIAELEAENQQLKQRGQIDAMKARATMQDSDTKRLKAVADIAQAGAENPEAGRMQELEQAIITLGRNQQAILQMMGGSQ